MRRMGEVGISAREQGASAVVAVAAAVSRMGDPHLAGWLMPLLLVIGAGYLASRYARG